MSYNSENLKNKFRHEIELNIIPYIYYIYTYTQQIIANKINQFNKLYIRYCILYIK